MSVYSIFFSPTGGTKKVMDCIISAWTDVKEVDLSEPAVDYSTHCFTENDICLIGFPVFEGRVPPIVLERLKKMKANNTPCAMIAVFGNRAINDALLEMKNELLSIGFLPYGAVSAVAQHSSLPMYGVGRPDEADKVQLNDFSAKLKKAVQGTLKPVNVPGGEPYIVIPIPPWYPEFDSGKCTGCHLCATMCPTAAIDKNDLSRLDTEVCARCVRCVSVCPTGARYLDPARREATAERLAKLFYERKPNLLYIQEES